MNSFNTKLFSATGVLIGLIILLGQGAPIPQTAQAYGGSCSEYGIMAYEMGGYCQCMSGYVFGTDFLGKKTCVSGDSVCSDKYGYASNYDSSSNSCECNYGYSLQNKYGKTQCVSNTSICYDQLGVMSQYDSLSKSCECMSGYVISNGQCQSGNTVCHSKHGLYSSYKSYNNTCECDYGYTLDDSSQCVKKQNNVYFTLKEIDTDNKQAIIRSDYDYGYYLVTYGSGCYNSSFRRYLNQKIVVNLGTDYSVDSWDKIVLQDDSETCDISRVQRANSSTTLVPEEETPVYHYVPTAPAYTAPSPKVIPAITSKPVVAPTNVKITVNDFEVPASDIESFTTKAVIASPAALRKCPTAECNIIRYYAETSEVTVIGKYNKDNWYKIDGTTDAGGGGQKVTGWIHGSLFVNLPTASSQDIHSSAEIVGTTSNVTEEPKPSIWNQIWKTVFSWFGK